VAEKEKEEKIWTDCSGTYWIYQFYCQSVQRS